MTADEHRAKGFVCVNGNWYAPGTAVAKAHRFATDTGTAPKLERNLGHGNLGTVPVQAKLGRRFLVRIVSVRKRLLDEDNLCEKYHVDLLRYAGILPSDAPGTAKIECTQKKADPGEGESISIEVFEIETPVLNPP